MSIPYRAIAECYDRLNSDIDYDNWANFLHTKLQSLGVNEGALVLDLACGTGNITLPLSRLGYDMIGVDLSEDMLGVARDKSLGKNVLWLCQDMRSFELYGTVGAIVCCLDSINYLTDKKGLEACFALAHNYLDPNGIFIFDVNTEYKFKNVYGDQHYVLEDDGVLCAWRNYYDPKKGICDFDLSVFYENKDGSYERFDETQREKYWSTETLTSALKKNGFEILQVTSDFYGSPVTEDSERAFFISRAIK